MKRTNSALTFFLFALFSLPMTGLTQAQATETSTGRYIFEYCHSSYSISGSLQTHNGFSIDNEGIVWSYDHGEDQWTPKGSSGLIYENDLYEKYRDLKQIGTVDKSVLSAMVSLIEPASQGETNQNGRRVEGMDSMTYSAYLFDPGQGTYTEIVLSMRGSSAAQNTSSAAKTLVSWLESVFSQSRSGSQEPGDARLRPLGGTAEPEPARSRKFRPVAGSVVIQPGSIQKIPAAKPEIKVEVSGPFPIEERSR